MTRGRGIAVLTTVAMLLGPTAAKAGTVYGGYGFSYTDSAGQPNRLTVSAASDNTGTTLTFVDPTGIVVGDLNCRYISEPTRVACSGDPDQGVDLSLGFGKDSAVMNVGAIRVVAHGGSGNDAITGGTGADALYGDTGADRLYGRAGNDRLYGGPGFDSLLGGPGVDVLDGLRVDVRHG